MGDEKAFLDGPTLCSVCSHCPCKHCFSVCIREFRSSSRVSTAGRTTICFLRIVVAIKFYPHVQLRTSVKSPFFPRLFPVCRSYFTKVVDTVSMWSRLVFSGEVSSSRMGLRDVWGVGLADFFLHGFRPYFFSFSQRTFMSALLVFMSFLMDRFGFFVLGPVLFFGVFEVKYAAV